jgi:phosphopantetheinyl transferase
MEREFGWTELPEIARTETGKPYFPKAPGVQFNWSHSGPYVLCACSAKPVGADIERVRPRKDSLPAYALTERELAEYRRLGADWPAFFALWTRKEAWCKYTGEGLSVLWKQTPPETGLYYGAYAGADWRAAVCGEEEPPEKILWVDRGELP